ncbi:TetR/AcrR family transcriptional regulator [Paracoccus sp. WLY502]|uniref:TetR/AcrR family transcriptional regulator n=1 Tax=Paracoccus yibinensis TaxID=3068891 RepID=UPI002796AD7F|nr:TetR/AcrR family transcriptional regulator [Paracoccus sp. WLY502]MDQ1899997.1 TetR/AcrR family transcriptional regulator [Paracoccus sp. WLY502]
MARPRSIDRDKLLDAAEEIMRSQGAGALTIDALARACGITKGGVQYAIGSKDDIIDALFARWNQHYDTTFAAIAGPDAGPVQRLRAHLAATRQADELSMSKAASLMAGLMQTPEHLASTERWYRDRLAGLDLSTPQGRRARLAFLACEGAFLLHFLRFMPLEDAEWQAVFDDIAGILDGGQAG